MSISCERLVICWVQSAKLHLCIIIIIFINMNVSGDGHASLTHFWPSLRDDFYNTIFSHLLPSVECFQTVLNHEQRCTLMPLEKAIDGFERNLFGTSALLSVFSSRKKREWISLYFPSLALQPRFFALPPPFALSRGIITVLLNISYTSIPLFSFTWQTPSLTCPRVQEINKTHPTVDTPWTRPSVCLSTTISFRVG